MKHFRQSYGNQATRHSPKRLLKMERVVVSTTCLWRIWAIFNVVTEPYSMTQYDKWVKAGLKHELCQVATAVLKPIERAMQPWIDGPRRTRRTQRTRRTRRTRRTPCYARCMFRCFVVGVRRSKTLRHVTVLWYTGAWSTISTYSRWVAEWPMFVGDLSLKAECGSHTYALARPGTPWHALARPGTPWHALARPVETCGFPGFHAGHGLDLVLALSCMSYRHAMKSSQAERKRQSSAWTKTETFLSITDDGKTMVTWCSMWLQVRERQCGPRIPTSPTLQLQKSDVQTTSNLTINSFAKSSNVLLQIRWILSRSTSRGFAFWVCCQYANVIVVTPKYQAHW